jgi:hypothetical protein
MIFSYKPWGNIDWITKKLAHIEQWGFLGNISTEERSLCAWRWLKDNSKLINYEMWKINDISAPPSPFKEITDEQYVIREKEYFKNDGQKPLEFSLLESDEKASEYLRMFMEKTNGYIIIDISTIPKRWFFPIIKECIENQKVKNLLVTYTIAKFYSKKQGEDPLPWKYFPSFGELPGREEIEKIFIISAGYQPLSLPEWISQHENPKIYILFPFPASISGYTRAWDFVRSVETDCGPIERDYFNIKFVSGYDLPIIYDTITEIIELENGKESKKEPILIPYGPKPVSLAFAILSSQLHFPVGYTQPMYYNPYYSSGFEETVDKVPKTMTYLLKESGEILYKPPAIEYA